jgi:hypothetical protein
VLCRTHSLRRHLGYETLWCEIISQSLHAYDGAYLARLNLLLLGFDHYLRVASIFFQSLLNRVIVQSIIIDQWSWCVYNSCCGSAQSYLLLGGKLRANPFVFREEFWRGLEVYVGQLIELGFQYGWYVHKLLLFAVSPLILTICRFETIAAALNLLR